MDRKPNVMPEQSAAGALASLPSAHQLAVQLPPKGACWYCHKPLDAVRRFCCKACGEAYREEAQYSA